MIALIFQNHYERLQVGRHAGEDEIKAAYRRLARIHHPDVAADRERGRKAFLLIKESYEILSDPRQRRDYDELLSASERFKARHPNRKPPPAATREPPPQPGPAGNAEREPPLRTPNARSRASTPPPRSCNRPDSRRPHRSDLDAHATLEVTLEEALFGTTQTITFEKDGDRSADHHFKSIEVTVPPASAAGAVLLLHGKGHWDPKTRERGHLHLTIAYARHERFRALGANLFTSIEIYPWDGALGAMIGIPTLEGQASLKIPPGSQPWQSFRLKGYGMPDSSGQRGDLIVSLKFLQPPAENARQTVLWKQLREAYK